MRTVRNLGPNERISFKQLIAEAPEPPRKGIWGDSSSGAERTSHRIRTLRGAAVVSAAVC